VGVVDGRLDVRQGHGTVRPMGRQLGLDGLAPVFRGSDAVRAGVLSPGQLRGSAVQRLFQGVYSLAGVARTHALYCLAAGLVLPSSAVVTGRSAATIRGIALARTEDPVEVLVPLESRVVRGSGLAVRRTVVKPHESVPWSGIRLATPQRMALDLLLHRPLPTRSLISTRCYGPDWWRCLRYVLSSSNAAIGASWWPGEQCS
jgi:hypothetical protein